MEHHPGRICAACGKAALQQCGHCRTARYCSAACQREHWKRAVGGHKVVCAPSCELAESTLIPAAAVGDLATVRAALAAGAATNYICKKPVIAMPSASIGCGSAVGFAAVGDHVEIVEELLRAGADPDLAQHDSGSALLMLAKFNALRAAAALIAGGATVDSRSDKGFTALHHAAMQGFVPLATMLLDAGAGINELTCDGDSPLFVAARAVSLMLPTGTTVRQFMRTAASPRVDPPPATRGGGLGGEGDYAGIIRLLQARGGRCIWGHREAGLEAVRGLGNPALMSTLKSM